jgi:RimJ/RimL family protein N-acetyltransferase
MQMELKRILNTLDGGFGTQGLGEDASQVIRATVDLYARRGHQPPWVGYLAVEDGRFVGTCGFTGPPNQAEVEIAYFTFPSHEGRGVAVRMGRELLSLTRRTATMAGIGYIAHTLPQEGASANILRKLGFTCRGEIVHPEDGVVWKWSESAARP